MLRYKQLEPTYLMDKKYFFQNEKKAYWFEMHECELMILG